MTWRVIFTPKAERDFKRLPKAEGRGRSAGGVGGAEKGHTGILRLNTGRSEGC